MTDREYILKLERRIHNQRAQMRWMWADNAKRLGRWREWFAVALRHHQENHLLQAENDRLSGLLEQERQRTGPSSEQVAAVLGDPAKTVSIPPPDPVPVHQERKQ